MMGYIFVIDFGRYINVNINHYSLQTWSNFNKFGRRESHNCVLSNPIIAFFLGWREYAKVLALIWLE